MDSFLFILKHSRRKLVTSLLQNICSAKLCDTVASSDKMGLLQFILGCAAIATVPMIMCQDAETAIYESLPDGVEEIMLPMCRNFLPYGLTKLPNRFGHVTQVEVYRYIIFFIYALHCKIFFPKLHIVSIRNRFFIF